MTEILKAELSHADPLVLWLLMQFETEEGGEFPMRLVLGHLNQHDVPARMASFAIEAHSEPAARTFAAQLRYQAKSDAEIRGAMQRYSVQCEWGNGQSAYHAFTEQGNPAPSAEALALTEPPDSTGLIKQLMRHLEVQTRIATRATVSQQEDFLKREERMQTRIGELESDRLQVLELTEKLMDNRAERVLQADQAAAAEARRERFADEFMGILPIAKAKLAQHFAGKLPGDHPMMREAQHQLTAGLFDGLTKEQLFKILEELPPAKQAQMLELYKSTMLPAEPEAATEDKPAH